MKTDLLLKSLDLASIATWIMIIGFAVLVYVSRSGKHKSSTQKSTKK